MHPIEDGYVDPDEYPIHALTQRPMAMYHSWGTQNAWLRQIHGHNPLYVPTKIWEANGFAGWRLGPGHFAARRNHRARRRIRQRSTTTPSGHGTPSANAKALGRWTTDAPEATKGFLLNHLIHELLPPKGDGLRWANSDPITGQAAWFDLRVKIEKSAIPNESQPVMPAIKSPVGKGPE